MGKALPGMSLAIVGTKGSGKTSAIAHLCQSLGGFPQQVHEECENLARSFGRPYCGNSWMLDKLVPERERGMTIDSTLQSFQSESFSYTAIDTPGHLDFVKNMFSVTSLADVAVLVVPAIAKEFEEGLDSGRTRELALGCFTMGIKNIVVWVTKLDDPSVEYASNRFEEIKKAVNAFLKEVGYKQKEVPFVPISGRYGDNLTTLSTSMSWYGGKTAINVLDDCGPINRPAEKPLRLPVLKVLNAPGTGTVIVGRVETGTIRPGTKLLFAPSGITVEARSMQKDGENVTEAKGGDIIGVNVEGDGSDLKINRGMVASLSSNDPVADAETFIAQVVVLDHPGYIRAGYCPAIAVHTAQVPCEFEQLISKIDRKTKEESEPNPERVKTGEVVTVRMRPRAPVCIEPFSAFPSLGRFAVRDHGRTVAVGIVKEVTKRPICKTRSSNANQYFDAS